MHPIHLEWYDESHSIILWKNPERYANEMMIAAKRVGDAMLENSSAPVVDVVMVLNTSDLNGSSNILQTILNAENALSDKIGLLVIVAPEAYLRIMSTTVKTIKGDTADRIKFAPTVDDAVALIDHLRMCV